jgi:hypothetical protein
MATNLDRSDMSDLERELELEMDEGELGDEGEFESDSDTEFEDADRETDDAEFEQDEEFEAGGDGDFASQLAELASREFESESELDGALSRVLGELEREYFFGRIKRFAKKVAKSKLGRAGFGALKGFLKRKFKNLPGLSMLGGLQAFTKLARGDLRGALANLAKAAMPSVLAAIPGGAVALPALQALGFRESADPDANHEAWENFVSAAREAYDHLAQNLNEHADQPLEASRLATAAFQQGVRRMSRGRLGAATGARRRVRTIVLRPGERLRVISS